MVYTFMLALTARVYTQAIPIEEKARNNENLHVT